MAERIVLLGGGGREHAVARAIATSSIDHELFAAASNRNPGIAELAVGFETLEETDTDRVVRYAESVDATAAVIGPEAPLEAGVVDALDRVGIYAFGPRQEDARIETDKVWQRRFMRDRGIPGCPAFETFDDTTSAIEYVNSMAGDVAVKPRGLTGGKGVRVTGDQLTKDEAVEYMQGADYDDWVIEERLVGEEFTLQAIVANGEVRPTPAVQDHKRAYEDDEGPNTGGMGSYSDARESLPFMTRDEYDRAVEILEATVDALPAYRGVLYGQFMATAEGPKVVEYNARFGDPEAMNTLPVLETDFVDILAAARDGRPLPSLEFSDRATVCKYAVPEGYPTDPTSGARITVDEATIERVNARYRDAIETSNDRPPEALLFYASVDDRPDGLYTTTSRSFAVVGIGDSIATAETLADEALGAAGAGVRIRHDIGKDHLVRRRIRHMERLRG